MEGLEGITNEPLSRRHIEHDFEPYIAAIAQHVPVPETFKAKLRERLIAGASTYGDASFNMKAPQLLHEIAQEFLDVPGWAFILWVEYPELMNTTNLIKVVAWSVKMHGKIE